MNAFQRDYYKLMLLHPIEWWRARRRVRNEIKWHRAKEGGE